MLNHARPLEDQADSALLVDSTFSSSNDIDTIPNLNSQSKDPDINHDPPYGGSNWLHMSNKFDVLSKKVLNGASSDPLTQQSYQSNINTRSKGAYLSMGRFGLNKSRENGEILPELTVTEGDQIRRNTDEREIVKQASAKF
ncbi:hypothetical protein M5K25_001230 [Dendrobium thyrsiflorum]|uniref:Uncharacterized protein n=1 Tax=Dendrobium thyrsiflorum TaxID=117978 RepID=A0ABD0VQ04_DENTH